jgi:acyl carrier protein
VIAQGIRGGIDLVILKVRKLLAEILSVEAEDVTARMPLTKDYGVDPLDIAKLIIACEREFKVLIYDEDVLDFRCVSDIAAYIDNLLSLGLNEMPERTEEDRTAWFYE